MCSLIHFVLCVYMISKKNIIIMRIRFHVGWKYNKLIFEHLQCKSEWICLLYESNIFEKVNQPFMIEIWKRKMNISTLNTSTTVCWAIHSSFFLHFVPVEMCEVHKRGRICGKGLQNNPSGSKERERKRNVDASGVACCNIFNAISIVGWTVSFTCVRLTI